MLTMSLNKFLQNLKGCATVRDNSESNLLDSGLLAYSSSAQQSAHPLEGTQELFTE